MKFFSKAGTLINHRKKGFIMPFSMVFCMLQLSLLLLLVTYSQQQGLILRYKEMSSSFMLMEKSSRTLMLALISKTGHIETSQWIGQQPIYWWDLQSDHYFDAVTVFSLVNVKSNEIEWVAIHYVLKEKYPTPQALPIFETRIVPTASRRAKMIHHSYVHDSKAVYQYVYNVSQNKLTSAKISIPSNETN